MLTFSYNNKINLNTTKYFQAPTKAVTIKNEFDVEMPSLNQAAIGVSKALTSLLTGNSASTTNSAWNNNPAYEAPKLTWNNNSAYEAPSKAATATKDIPSLSISKSKNHAPAAKMSDEELAWKLQQEEFEFAYGRKASNKAELTKTLQETEDMYFAKMLQAEEDAALAKSLQAKEEQEANDAAIAKLLQENEDAALARMLQAEEDAALAKSLQAKEEQEANDAAIAKLLQENEDAAFALQLQQAEVANYYNSFANPIQSYSYFDIPVIGNDFEGYYNAPVFAA